MLSGLYRTRASAEFVVTTLQAGKHLEMNCRMRRGIYALLIPLNSVGTRWNVFVFIVCLDSTSPAHLTPHPCAQFSRPCMC